MGTRFCLHPDAPAECSGAPIEAHSVSKQATLRLLASDGHVYEPSPSPDPAMQLVGINKASTFRGFCGKHDTDLFSQIDNEPFSASPEQCFLHGYRALSLKTLRETAATASLPAIHQHESGAPHQKQRFVHDRVETAFTGTVRALEIARACKIRYDAVLREKRWDEVRFLWATYEAPPPLACSSILGPKYDFQGKLLQSLSGPWDPEWLTVHSFLSDGKGYFVLSWLQSSAGIGTRFAESLISLPAREVPDAVLLLVLTYTENVFIAPAWWDQLTDQKRRTLLSATLRGRALPLRPGDLIVGAPRIADWKLSKFNWNS
jgi:hypothetical protein